MMALIKSLSSLQIRAHYVIYQTLRQLFLESKLNISTNWKKFKFYIPINEFFISLGLSSDRIGGTFCPHVIVGLANKGLIDGDYHFGVKEFLGKVIGKEFFQDGIIVTPSVLGTQLLFYANGLADELEKRIVDKELKFYLNNEITLPTKAESLSKYL